MKYTTLSLCLIALGLNACDHYSHKMVAFESSTYDVQNIEPAAGANASNEFYVVDQGPRFSEYLKQFYRERATYEQSVGDYKAAKHCIERVEVLNAGQLVTPMTIENVNIPVSKKRRLSEAREALMNALKNQAMPANRQNLAAAQVSFDCWVDQTLEEKEDSSCEQEYNKAMRALINPNMTEKRYVLSSDSAVLTHEDTNILNNIISGYNDTHDGEPHSSLTKIILNGSGSEKSEARIAMIKSILQYNGVSPSAVTTFNNLEVGQAVEIIVKKPAATLIETSEASSYSDTVTVR